MARKRISSTLLHNQAVIAEILKRLVEAIQDHGGNPDEELKRIRHDDPLLDELATVICRVPLYYSVTVEPNMTLEERIKEAIEHGGYSQGRYSLGLTFLRELLEGTIIEGDIGDRQNEETVKIRLLCLNREMSSSEVLEEIEERGYLHTKADEFLELIRRHPHQMKRLDGVATLGAIWETTGQGLVVMCLKWASDCEEHFLSYQSFNPNSTWPANYYFAVLDKESEN